MDILNQIAHFFGDFSLEMTLAAIIICGMTGATVVLKLNRRYFLEATLLLLFAIIFNKALKYTFKIPLPEHLGSSSYALPSGHMHSVFVFYGWLAYRYKSRILTAVTAVLMLGVAFELLYFNYHTLIDILAALFFGSLVLLGFNWVQKKYYADITPITMVLTSLLMIYIYFVNHHVLIGEIWGSYILANACAFILHKRSTSTKNFK
jgi:membrane-associated phospholipid phosphatase